MKKERKFPAQLSSEKVFIAIIIIFISWYKEKESDKEKQSLLLFDNKDALNHFLKEKFDFQL